MEILYSVYIYIYIYIRCKVFPFSVIELSQTLKKRVKFLLVQVANC